MKKSENSRISGNKFGWERLLSAHKRAHRHTSVRDDGKFLLELLFIWDFPFTFICLFFILPAPFTFFHCCLWNFYHVRIISSRTISPTTVWVWCIILTVRFHRQLATGQHLAILYFFVQTLMCITTISHPTRNQSPISYSKNLDIETKTILLIRICSQWSFSSWWNGSREPWFLATSFIGWGTWTFPKMAKSLLPFICQILHLLWC